MKSQKRAEQVSECLGEIDGRYITEAENYRPRRGSAVRPWLIGGVAAALCVAIGLSVVLPLLDDSTPYLDPPIHRDPPPNYDDAYLTAADIDALFADMKTDSYNGATNAYVTLFAPGVNELYINAIPDDDYVPVYRYTPQTKTLNRRELEAFIDDIYPRLEEALGVTVPDLTYQTDEQEMQIMASYPWDAIRYNIRTGQSSGETSYVGNRNACHRVLITADSGDTIDIDGTPIRIDQRLSDGEILSSLACVRDRLFEVFGQSFDSAKVTRRYNEWSEYGAIWVYVTYYNAADPEGEGDALTLSFDNFQNFSGDTVSESILQNCSIEYTRYRVSVPDTFVPEANCRRLSIEEAEALLYAGYVFGGHVCPLCMAMQTPVSFEDYEYVGFTYITGYASESGSTLSVPFYAFYQDIGEAENGNRTYARTLVPAVEISGLETYFDMQKENHPDTPWYETIPE